MMFSDELAQISTANIADAHDHLGLVCKWISRDLTPTSRLRFWGKADVVQWGPSRKTEDIRAKSLSTWDEVKAFVDQLTEGDGPKVYIAGCQGVSKDYVLLGGMSLTYLSKLGYVGVVANGIIRDYEEVMELNMPVWSFGFGVMDSQGCMKVESRGQTCTVNGHVVEQEDLVIGDGNGVIAISVNKFNKVLEKASEIARIENQVLEKIKGGQNLFSLVENWGHI